MRMLSMATGMAHKMNWLKQKKRNLWLEWKAETTYAVTFFFLRENFSIKENNSVIIFFLELVMM